MIKTNNQTAVKTKRKFDQTFKREAVNNWLASGKSARVVALELGILPNRLYAWKEHFAPADPGGKAAAGAKPASVAELQTQLEAARRAAWPVVSNSVGIGFCATEHVHQRPPFIFGHRLAPRFDPLFHPSSLGLVVHFWLRRGEPLVFADGRPPEHHCHRSATDPANPEFAMRHLPPAKSPESAALDARHSATTVHVTSRRFLATKGLLR